MDWHSSAATTSSSQHRQDAPRAHHDDRHRRPSTSSRPPLPPGPHPHHKGRIVNPATGREDNCRLVHFHDKQPIYRFRGVCPEPFSSFNVTAVRDPRDRDKINAKTLPQDLSVPDLKLDFNYVGVPDQREVAIYNLNDNVNDALLRRFCQKVIDPEELMVCYHPTSRKHMKMALVECRSSADARKFVKYANETELMGSKVSALLDPLADQLNSEFNKKTGSDLPSLPKRLKDVGTVLEVLRERLRDTTRNDEPAVSTGSSPMDCDSEGLSPIDLDITPSSSAMASQVTAPPALPPADSSAPPKKVRSRPSRFSDSPDIPKGPIPLAKVFVNLRTPSFRESSSASPATPIALGRFPVPPSPMINACADRRLTTPIVPPTPHAYPPPVANPPLPPAMPSSSIPPTPATWEHLPPPPPVPIPTPAGQLTPTPADPTLPKKEMKEKRRQSERSRRCSASASTSSSSEEERESRRRSKKKHSRAYRRRSERRRRRSRNSSSVSESSASTSESGETSSSEDASDDERFHRDRRKHSHRYPSHKRSESSKRKVTEKIVTHKRQVITSKDTSTVKDTYIHIVSRRFENSPEVKERTSPDSDDLPIINESVASKSPGVADAASSKPDSNLDVSDMLVMEDISSDDEVEGRGPKKEASHTWSSTSDTAASTDDGERRRRSKDDSPIRKSKRRDSKSPKRRRAHKESKRRREKSPSPASLKEHSKSSSKKKCLDREQTPPPPPPPPQAPVAYPPMPSTAFCYAPPNIAYAPQFPKFDASKPPPNFHPFVPPMRPVNIMMGQLPPPPPPMGAQPPYTSMYPVLPPPAASVESAPPTNDLTSRLAELFPEQMNSDIPKKEEIPKEVTPVEDPSVVVKKEEEEIKEPPPKKIRTRKSRFDVVAESPPSPSSLPPPSGTVKDEPQESEEDVARHIEKVTTEVFRRICAELKEQILKDLLSKRDTYTFEELEVRWDRLLEEHREKEKEREKEEPTKTEDSTPSKENKENEAVPSSTTESSSNWAIGFESMFRSTSLRLLPRIQKVKNPAAIAAMKRHRRRRRSRSVGDVSRSSSDTEDRDSAASRISSTDSERDHELEGSPISEKSESPVIGKVDEEEEVVEGLMSSGEEDNDVLDAGGTLSGRLSAVSLGSEVSDEEEDEVEEEEGEEGEYESSVEDDELDVEIVGPVAPLSREKMISRRSEYVEELILENFTGGCDDEDIRYLQKAFEKMTADDPRPFGRPVLFGRFPEIPPVRQLTIPKKTERKIYYFDDPELEGVAPHRSGCARTEGFYRTKKRRTLVRRPEEETSFKDKTEISAKDETSVRQNNTSRRELKAANRRNLTVMSEANSDMFKVNQLKFRKKMIKFARSKIHGWGLYAMETIAADEMIVEYVGELIRPAIADEREKHYEKRGIGSSYLFRIDRDSVIDATKKGNFARFINHSCQPNCYARVVTLEGEKRIVIYSKTQINKGDEITYDYKFPIEEEKIECLCGAPQCRRFLN
ncbi:hypothetical protein QR680_013007 [Steinernema hermaphroditum]|uniref:[histone H3]-lysine(4) N-trimethyltransferase n=1 Tax=Steinernema hermaphroditum TaxID=289476 RepID=A0AA39I652_9BILA|nr:hypothetical protein QR680_013007 [Steinernema hermaphroditum]